MPDQDDSYQVDDFNENVNKISKYFASKPVMTPYKDLAEFIKSGKTSGYKMGDTVAIHDIIYILIGEDPTLETNWMPYGAEALVIMKQYIPTAERHNGSLYMQIGNTRRLIIKVFREFFYNLLQISATTNVVNGVAFSIVRDIVTVSGTASGSTIFTVGTMKLYKDTPYKLRGCPLEAGNAAIEMRTGETVLISDTGNGTEYTPTEDTQVSICISIPEGWENTGKQFKPRVTVIKGCTGVTPYTLLIKETTAKTINTVDNNDYGFNVKNLTLLENGDTSVRVRGKLYLVKEKENE
nr:MAG TPA: hypothetical protein [Caudoviricetes sp.]